MKRVLGITTGLFIFLLAQFAFAQPAKIGVVNVNQLFNDSPFVQKANEQLQANVKDMETKMQEQQKKVQDLALDYEKASEKNKPALRNKIQDEQAKLNQLTQDYQQQIRDEQNKGMQQFSEQVRVAVEQVAKKRQLNAVLSNTAIIFNDNTLVDVTAEVSDILKKQ